MLLIKHKRSQTTIFYIWKYMIPQKKQSDDQLHIQKFSRHFHKQEINKHKVEKCKPCGFYYETKVDPL